MCPELSDTDNYSSITMTVRLRKRDWKELEAEAARTGRPLSEIVSRMIIEALEADTWGDD